MALTALNLLSARKVETAQPRPKVYQLRDGGSLFLRVQPNGSKLWWYRYRLGGAEQVYSIGVYPKITLEAARACWRRLNLDSVCRSNFDRGRVASIC